MRGRATTGVTYTGIEESNHWRGKKTVWARQPERRAREKRGGGGRNGPCRLKDSQACDPPSDVCGDQRLAVAKKKPREAPSKKIHPDLQLRLFKIRIWKRGVARTGSEEQQSLASARRRVLFKGGTRRGRTKRRRIIRKGQDLRIENSLKREKGKMGGGRWVGTTKRVYEGKPCSAVGISQRGVCQKGGRATP